MAPHPQLGSLIIVFVTVIIDFLSLSIILPILPFYARHFDASSTLVGVLFGAYAATSFVSTIFMGRLSDRFGRRPLLLLSLTGSSLGAIAQGLAWSIESLIVFRAATGLLGGSITTAQAYIADVTSKEERPHYLALLMAVVSAAFVFGPSMGAGLAEFGLNVPLLVAGGLSSVAWVFAYVKLEESNRPTDDRELSKASVVPEIDDGKEKLAVEQAAASDGPERSRVDTALEVEPLDSEEQQRIDVSRTLAMIQDTTVQDDEGLSEGVRHRRQESKPSRGSAGSAAQLDQPSLDSDLAASDKPKQGLDRVAVVFVCMGGFLNAFAFTSFSVIFGLFSADKFGYSALQISYTFSGLGMLFFFTQGFAYDLVLKVVRIPIACAVGAAIMGVGLIVIPLPDRPGVALLGVGIMGLGTSAINPSVSTLLSRMASAKSEQGRVLSYGQMSDGAARVIAPFVLGGVYESDADLPFFICGACSLLNVLVWLVVAARIPSMRKPREVIVIKERKDQGREPTEEEVIALGAWLSGMLRCHGYSRWYDHLEPTHLVLRAAFPPVREGPEGYQDVLGVVQRAREFLDVWPVRLG